MPTDALSREGNGIMKKAGPGACVAFAIALASGFPTASAAADSDEIRAAACGAVSAARPSPWHVANLFDCKTGTFFIPYQLWAGARWDGNKAAACMHTVGREWDITDHRTVPTDDGDTRDVVRPSRTFVKGPVRWTNPETGEVLNIWERHKSGGRKLQRFACHPKGIGRVTDFRKTPSWRTPQPVGRCKFPAGHGWALGKKRECLATAIEITKVELDADKTLAAITFKWWVRRGRSTELYFDHIYRYARERGATDAWAQSVVAHGESNYRRRGGQGRRRRGE
jgi:hypothetical protein